MPSFCRIKATQRSDGTQAIGQVGMVFVAVADSSRAKVEAAGSKDTVVEVSMEGFILVQKLLEMVGIVGMKTWSPCC